MTIIEFKGDVLAGPSTPAWRAGMARAGSRERRRTRFKAGRESAHLFTVRRLEGSSENPESFEKSPGDPDEMAYKDLADYVRRLEHGGLRAEKYQVQLHQKFAFPWINLIVVVMGAALAARMRNPNAALGFGISVSTAFFYVGLMRAGQALGQSGSMPPVAAAWFANALLGLVALGLLVQAQRR